MCNLKGEMKKEGFGALASHVECGGLPPLFCLAFALVFMALGCGPNETKTAGERIANREAVFNLGAAPRALDPALGTDTASAEAMMAFLRGLTIIDAGGRAQPDMAESWTVSPDGRTYVFKLRQTEWSNGDPVTADDFVYAWIHRVLNPAVASEYAYQLYNYIDGARAYYEDASLGADSVGVRALAPDSLEVRLANPTPYFPALVAHQIFFPVNPRVVRADPNWSASAQSYCGCGPFTLTERRAGDRLIGKKNPGYWNAANVGLDRIVYRMIEKESTELAAYETGEIDVTHNAPTEEIMELRQRGDCHHQDLLATYYLELNVSHKPLDDPRVRRALAMAIDRRAIAERVMMGGQKPAVCLTPPSLYNQNPEPYYKDADYAQARRLLAEAGYPGGEGFPRLRYLYNTMEGHRKIAQVIQQSWKKELGIDISVENQEFKVVLDNKAAGDFDIARAGWTADFPDAITFLGTFTSDSDNNNTRWGDPGFDAMMMRARAETDPARREAILLEAEKRLGEAMPVIPIYHYTVTYLVNPKLENYRRNFMDMPDLAKVRWREERP